MASIVSHAVVDEEDLAAAVELAQDRVADQAGRRTRRRTSGSAGDPRAASRSRSGRGRRPAPGCSVRGIGVADSVSTSTSRRSCFRRSLCGHAEALLLVDDDQAEVA